MPYKDLIILCKYLLTRVQYKTKKIKKGNPLTNINFLWGKGLAEYL